MILLVRCTDFPLYLAALLLCRLNRSLPGSGKHLIIPDSPHIPLGMERKSELILIQSFKSNLQHFWSPCCIVTLIPKPNTRWRRGLSGAATTVGRMEQCRGQREKNWEVTKMMWKCSIKRTRGAERVRKKLQDPGEEEKRCEALGYLGISEGTLGWMKEDGSNCREKADQERQEKFESL